MLIGAVYGQDREVITNILNTKIISLDCIHNKLCHKISSLGLLLIILIHMRVDFETSDCIHQMTKR